MDNIVVNKDKLIDLLNELYTATGECYACPLHLEDNEGICKPNESCVESMIRYLKVKENK